MTKTVSVLALSAVLLASAGIADADLEAELEQDRAILERLNSAPPAPNPVPKSVPREAPASEQGSTVGHDLQSGETRISPHAAPRTREVPQSPPFVAPLPGNALGAEEEATEIEPAAASQPNQIFNTTAYPVRTIVKLLMRFNVNGFDYFYVCSGMVVGSFHVLTAGHCLYNWDPNDDDNVSDRRWANEVWVYAAQTDWTSPYGVADRLFGEAKGIYLRSYTNWTESQDSNHDWGVITLNRRDGDHTGWMGREWGIETTALNFSGYPSETPYVPFNTLVQYAGYDAGNVLGYSSYVITLNALIWGGHSGGPSWRYVEPDRYIQGIHSRSDRMGTAYDTRLTEGKFNDIYSYMSEDETVRPPIARPDLIEYFFDSNNRKDLLTNVAEPGTSIQVEYNALNSGFVATGPFTVGFYLSTDTNVTPADLLIDTRVLDIAAYTFHNETTEVDLPGWVPDGFYYVGWIFSGGTTEYTVGNNAVVISDETLTVGGGCDDDLFEPDDASGSAKTISTGGTVQLHSICPVGDQDWMKFVLTAPASSVTIETVTGGDTRLWLYNSSLTELNFNDDYTGVASRIDRTCGVAPLGPGTYYVKVDEYAGDASIASYDVGVLASSCCGNGTVDGSEQCDGGPCCTGSCTYATTTQTCRSAAGTCDTAEKCSGTSGGCPADAKKANGTPCEDDANVCTDDKCNGTSSSCQHPANSSPCSNGAYCDGTDTCAGGSCSMHSGNPCPGADGDGDCSESCNEGADNCTANDPNGSSCSDGSSCTVDDQCDGGVCEPGTGLSEAGCPVTTTTLPVYLCGDANGDGQLKSVDALEVLRVATGLKVCALWICDYNGSGTITTSDALAVLKTAVGIVVQPKCPQPESLFAMFEEESPSPSTTSTTQP